MNVADLRAVFRSETDDTEDPPFASDDEVIDYLNDAQNEACRRARLLVDSRTSGITTISLAANTARYALDPRVVFVRRAKLVSNSSTLTLASYRDMDGVDGISADWEDETGTPTHLITDMDTAYVRPYPVPDASDSIALTVVRLPLDDLADDGDEPEIHARFHRNLRHWMLYRYYSKQDADTFDAGRAALALAAFEMEFGKPSRAIEEEWILRQQQTDAHDGVF